MISTTLEYFVRLALAVALVAGVVVVPQAAREAHQRGMARLAAARGRRD